MLAKLARNCPHPCGTGILQSRMSKVRISRRPLGARATAGVLLAGFLLLTLAPVCGSASDVDPDACCKRHGCQQSGAGSKTDGAFHHGRETCAGCDKAPCSSSDSPVDCCSRGDLAYPVARAQSAYQVAIPVLTLARISVHSCQGLPSNGSLSSQSASISPPLKINCVALHALHCVFRI